ncbi:metabotropic glutamate receptor-like [Mizuhopecten yessoensis]|uniref:Metabotropic glutamate receptor 3 n=2 Tax=Mizuhopecten yessoensis TaxID=6573 RepID=A0A210QBW8_MIZYE|nr:metabotropic glutamate receptor-like [Mizuhopecten yessoensis]OWF46220.1 Metabotropic glutamate receptor 3 [Mizuhopecten yessoensis]
MAKGLMMLILVLVSSLTVIQAQLTCPSGSSGSCQYTNVGLTPTNNQLPNQHYYIGGLFGVHDRAADAYSCQNAPLRERGLLNMEAFHWAIKEFGTNQNVSIGGVALDSCSRVEQTIENILSFETCKVGFGNLNAVSPRNLLAYVGPDRSSEAMAVATLLKDMNKTQVSHAATSPELNNQDMYPFFLRAVPSDEHDATIIAKMLQSLNIKYVLGVYLGNGYGRGGFEALKSKLVGTCMVYQTEMPVHATDDQLQAIADELFLREVTRYVIVYSDGENARKLMNAMQMRDANKVQNFNFIGTSSWADDTTVTDNLYVNAYTLALTTPAGQLTTDLAKFYQYLNNLKPSGNTWNPWFQSYWNDKLECGVRTCNEASDSLTGRYTPDVYVPFTILAVRSIIDGVRIAALSACGKYDLCSNLLNQENRGQRIYGGIGGTTYFNGQELANNFISYRILKFQVASGYTEIGTYTPGTPLNLAAQPALPYSCPESPCLVCGEVPPVPSTTTVRTTAAPVITTTDPTEGGKYKFIKFMAGQHFTGVFSGGMRMGDEYGTRFDVGQKWIIALGVLAGVGCVAVLVFEIYILFKLLGTRIGRQWRTMWLGQLLLFGIFLSYLTLFAFLFIPTNATCGIIRFGIGVSYATIYSVLLVKLMVILTSTTSESLIPGDVESPNYLKGIYQFLMFIFAVGVQVVIDIQWMIQVPPEAVKVMTNGGVEAWVCNHYTWSVDYGWGDMENFVRSEFENHLLSLVYVMFLIIITTIVAMRAHGIITNHRESVFIGIVAGFSIPIWIAWGLVGGLNKKLDNGHQFGDACLAFGLFIVATLALFSMFLPKVRQLINMGVEGIYLEDDRDTYYGGSVIMAPPSYKSRPSSVVYANSGGVYSDPIIIGNGGDPNAVHLKHPGASSTYSAPVYMKRGDTYGTGSIGGSKVLRVTGDLTGKNPHKPSSEIGHYRKTRSESGTLRRARSTQDLGSL